MKRVGLTGSIGSGKSTVSRLLRERGVTVLDADAAARALGSDPEVVREVSETFGPDYVTGGSLDRKALAALVFGDEGARRRLNAIIHPRVRAKLAADESEAAAGGADLVVQDIPLLFESGLQDRFDATILVDAPLSLRVQRVTERDGSDPEEVLRRDASQMPAGEKRRLATYILENDGSLEHLAAQVERVLVALGHTKD